MDHRRAFRATVKGPPAGWRRPRGRTRQTWSLWTVETDLQSVNVGLHTAWHRAQDHRLEWTRGDSYAASWGCYWWWWNWRISSLVFLPRDALVHSAVLRLHVNMMVDNNKGWGVSGIDPGDCVGLSHSLRYIFWLVVRLFVTCLMPIILWLVSCSE